MVGVPRSKGCKMCLRRSVKCDEARPSCSQCRRGGRTCPGYAREAKFIDEGARMPHFLTQNASKSNRPECDSASAPPLGAMSILATNAFSPDGLSSPCSWKRRAAPRLCRLDSLQLEAYQIISSFVSAMFPLGLASVQSSFLGSWLWHVPSRLGCDQALDYAALSLACAYFARISQGHIASLHSQMSYNLALKSLAKAIADKRRSLSSEVLCASLLLDHYERFMNVSHAWIQHAGGMARLMQLRGARLCYGSAFEYSMFLACRGEIISEALASGTPCFLDTEDWRSIPDGLIEFPLLPKYPELYHAIFNSFAAIPGFLNKVKSLTDDTPRNVRLSLSSTSRALQQSFRRWYEQYIYSDDGPALVDISPVPYPCPFHSTYSYSSTLSACMITAYYAYSILLNIATYRIHPDSAYVAENLGLARAICMSVDYCSRAGYCGVQTLRFSLPIAQSELPSEYIDWTALWIAKLSENS